MASKDFTDRDREIMAKAWQCFEGEPKVDYNKLATLCGMGNPRSASNAWAGIKKKIQAQAGGTPDGGASPVKNSDAGAGEEATPKPTPKKRGKAKAADGESPAKKAKSTPRKSKKEVDYAEADDEEPENGEAVKPEPVEEDDGFMN